MILVVVRRWHFVSPVGNLGPTQAAVVCAAVPLAWLTEAAVRVCDSPNNASLGRLLIDLLADWKLR